MTVVIVIPVFEEAATLGRVVAAACLHAPVLVVDDGSRDASAAVAAAAGAEVLRHPRRLGKAQALLTGFAAARRRGASLVVTLDGDGQHDPAAVPTLLKASREWERALVVGSRVDGPDTLPASRRNAIGVASFFASWIAGCAVRDSQSGFRVYPMALLDAVPTRRGGFVFETEILLAAAERGWPVREVGVAVIPRGAARSRFRPLRDGVAIGSFLARRVIGRWGRELRTMATEVLAVFEADRLARRHAGMLQAASPYTDSPLRWSAALGTEAARRAGLRLCSIWCGARARGTTGAALGTLAAPLALPLLLLQAVADGRLPDLVSPLVERVYGAPRSVAERTRGPAPVAPNALADRR
jgi:hypothetical protein